MFLQDFKEGVARDKKCRMSSAKVGKRVKHLLACY